MYVVFSGVEHSKHTLQNRGTHIRVMSGNRYQHVKPVWTLIRHRFTHHEQFIGCESRQADGDSSGGGATDGCYINGSNPPPLETLHDALT